MNRAASTAPRGLLIGLAAISALGSAAIHMLVPALPTLSADLAITPRSAQQAISFYLFGLAAGQLLSGPTSDRYGRRPVLLAGLALFIVGGALAGLALSTGQLLGGRVLQALGAGAGIVSARVIVGDLFGRDEAVRRQASLMGVVLLSPAIAPAIGGYIASIGGWRPILGLQALLALAVLAFAFRKMPETLERREGEGRNLVSDYLRLLRNRQFRLTMAAISLCSSALYMFLAVSPFLLIEHWGLSEREAGYCYLATAISAMGGTLVVARLARRRDAFRLGLGTCAIGGAAMLALALTTAGHWLELVGPVTFITFGVGIAGPASAARIVHAEEGLAATATSLSGAVQMLCGGIAASVIGAISAPSFVVLASAIALVSGVSLLLSLRSGQAPAISR